MSVCFLSHGEHCKCSVFGQFWSLTILNFFTTSSPNLQV